MSFNVGKNVDDLFAGNRKSISSQFGTPGALERLDEGRPEASGFVAAFKKKGAAPSKERVSFSRPSRQKPKKSVSQLERRIKKLEKAKSRKKTSQKSSNNLPRMSKAQAEKYRQQRKPTGGSFTLP